jgi:hypothetical protein
MNLEESTGKAVARDLYREYIARITPHIITMDSCRFLSPKSMNRLFLFVILLSISSYVSARDFSVKYSPKAFVLRGGSSTSLGGPFAGRTTTIKPASTASQSQQQSTSDKVDIKDQIDAFLTRDSRNSFIGKQD